MPNKFLEIALEANCTICTTECWGTIWDSSIIGDGVCSDDLNTPFCDYDGGDCCLPYIVKSCLYNCICHEDGLVHPTFESIVVLIITFFITFLYKLSCNPSLRFPIFDWRWNL